MLLRVLLLRSFYGRVATVDYAYLSRPFMRNFLSKTCRIAAERL